MIPEGLKPLRVVAAPSESVEIDRSTTEQPYSDFAIKSSTELQIQHAYYHEITHDDMSL